MPPAIVWVGLMLNVSYATASFIVAMGISVVSMAVMSRQSLPKVDNQYKAPSPDAYRENKQIVRGGNVNRRIGYGQVRTGGLLAFIDTTDIKGWNEEGNSDLYMAVAIFPHPVESFQNLHVNDKDLNWFRDSDNWTDADDIVTIIWHNNMDEFTEVDGHNGPIWYGDINGTAHGPLAYGLNGEDFDLYMNALGFLVETSFIDGGTRKHIKRGTQTILASSTSWTPQYNVAKTETTVPVWNSTTEVFDTETLTLVDNENMIKGLDGSNTWYLYKGTWNGFQYEYVRTTLTGVQLSGGTWKYFEWNGTSYDTIASDYDPSKNTTIDLTGKFLFENFNSFQVGQTDPDLQTIQASIDNMPGVLDVKYYNGTLDQQVDPALNALFTEWDSNHVGRGVSYFTTHLFYDYEALPNGIPAYNVTVMAKNDIIDPRLLSNTEDLTDIVAIRARLGGYTTNPAAIIMDYMISEFGLNIPIAEIDLDSFAIAANICDEPITLSSAASATAGARTYAPIEGYRTNIVLVDHGYTSNNDATIVQGTTTLTSNVNVVDADNFEIETGYLTEGVSITTALSQRRYTIDGVVDTGTQPSGVIDSMLSHTGGGSIVYDDGLYKLNVGAYKTPTSHITEDWIISDVKVQPRATRDQLFNAVKGTYIDKYKNFEATDYPAWENPTYCQEDNKGVACGQTDFIYTEINYPFCLEPNRARRLAKIALNKHRQALVVSLTCNLNAYVIDTGDFITMTIGNLGFIAKEFEVLSWTLTQDATIDLVLQETASEIYDWAEGEYNTQDLAVNTVLPSLTWPNQFDSIELTTAAYLDTSGSIVEQIIVTVVMSELFDYVTYADTEIEFKDALDADAVWTVASKGKSLVAAIQDVKMSLYAVRVRGTSKSAPPTRWYYSQIRTQGAGSLITEVSLPKPINPLVFFSIQNNEISKLKITVDWLKSEWTDQPSPPEFLIFMYSAEEERNELVIEDNTLKIESGEVLESGETAVINDAGNTTKTIRIFQDAVDTGVDLTGMWWCRVRRSDSSYSIFTKVLWYDEYYIHLARDLSFTPDSTDILEWYVLAFHDIRLDEFKLGCIADGSGSYEVILWDDLTWDGTQFTFDGVTRQAENSSLLDATGLTFSYYPAIGPGTIPIVIPASAFTATDDDTFSATYEVDISLPESLQWGAMSCMFGVNTVQDGVYVLARSPIVLPSYAGEV